jgi:hypothetical protein
MAGKAVISLTTGLEDPEKVTVAYLVAVGAAESGRPTLMFLTKEAVRLALDGVATGIACDGSRRALLRLPGVLQRQEARRVRPDRWRGTAGDDPTVGMDRRRRHHVQLLTCRSRVPARRSKGTRAHVWE